MNKLICEKLLGQRDTINPSWFEGMNPVYPLALSNVKQIMATMNTIHYLVAFSFLKAQYKCG